MDESSYRRLVRIAIVMVAAWAGWSLYQLASGPSDPIARDLDAARRQLLDGNHAQALEQYRLLRSSDPDNLMALRGESQALMQWAIAEAATLEQPGDTLPLVLRERMQQAVERMDLLIEREKKPSLLGIDYANRGIAKDWLGDYTGALADYRQALRLEPRVSEGPGFFTRFLRNQEQQQATVKRRAEYLQQQLALPESQRQLRKPTEYARQRAYEL